METDSITQALFLNGMYESMLGEIVAMQQNDPLKVGYLQPYSDKRIVHLYESAPSRERPVTLYISLTTSLGQVSYCGKAVKWHDKRRLEAEERAKLEKDLNVGQPSEVNGIYLDGGKCVNLISVLDLKPIKSFPVGLLIKTSDGKPLKERQRAGSWSVVYERPELIEAREVSPGRSAASV